MEHPYVVKNPQGQIVLQATAECRYQKGTELDLMDAGYSLYLSGRKLTKKEVRT